MRQFPKIKNRQILCIGEILWDRLPSGAKPGGAPLNVALHLHSMGEEVFIASRIGYDAPGKQLRSFIANSGLSTELFQVDEKLPTSEVIVHFDENNDPVFDICEPVAWDNIEPTQALVARAERSGVFIFGSLASRNAKTRTTLMKILDCDAIKFFDVNLRMPHYTREVVKDLLAKTDMVKLNDDELIVVSEWHNKQKLGERSIIKWLADHYDIVMVCITKGAEGAVLYYNGIFYEHRGYKVNVVDTVGAGDAFLAGIVRSLLNKATPEDSLKFACATGALVASKAGATPSYNIKQIRRIIDCGHGLISQNQKATRRKF